MTNWESAQVRGTKVVVPLMSSWDRIMATARKRGWHLAAERIFDDVEDGTAAVTTADTSFLILLASEPNTPAIAANTAIRLMGMLAEDDHLPRSAVFPTLVDLLIHDDTQRRYYAAKALWQARAREAVPALRRRLDREESEEVAAIIRRAIAVLE